MPDSSGSKDSPFDIGELIDSVLGQTAFFGANRHEQSENQQEAFEDIFEKLSEGAKVGNTYFQSFMQHRVQDFPFADFVYQPAENRQVPSLEEHYVQAQDQTSPLPIWRPEIMLDCQHHDLTDDEFYQLLEIFSRCLMGKIAISGAPTRNTGNVDSSQKDSYHLGILT